jgi:hypothetical protein
VAQSFLELTVRAKHLEIAFILLSVVLSRRFALTFDDTIQKATRFPQVVFWHLHLDGAGGLAIVRAKHLKAAFILLSAVISRRFAPTF